MIRMLKKNNDGMVLVTVLMVVVVMMIITIGILSRSSTQAVSAEKQIDRIKAEQFLKGFFWNVYANLANGLPIKNQTTVIDGKTYIAQVTLLDPIGGPNGTALYQFNVSY